jgi:hypothetical protein
MKTVRPCSVRGRLRGIGGDSIPFYTNLYRRGLNPLQSPLNPAAWSCRVGWRSWCERTAEWTQLGVRGRRVECRVRCGEGETARRDGVSSWGPLVPCRAPPSGPSCRKGRARETARPARQRPVPRVRRFCPSLVAITVCPFHRPRYVARSRRHVRMCAV